MAVLAGVLGFIAVLAFLYFVFHRAAWLVVSLLGLGVVVLFGLWVLSNSSYFSLDLPPVVDGFIRMVEIPLVFAARVVRTSYNFMTGTLADYL